VFSCHVIIMIETSQEVYFICIKCFNMASGHKDAALALYLLWGEEEEEWMSWVQKVDHQLVLMIKTPHTLHTHIRSYLYIYMMHFSTCYSG
jgi:hypothetical protein